MTGVNDTELAFLSAGLGVAGGFAGARLESVWIGFRGRRKRAARLLREASQLVADHLRVMAAKPIDERAQLAADPDGLVYGPEAEELIYAALAALDVARDIRAVRRRTRTQRADLERDLKYALEGFSRQRLAHIKMAQLVLQAPKTVSEAAGDARQFLAPQFDLALSHVEGLRKAAVQLENFGKL
jgi:hypothetical protein